MSEPSETPSADANAPAGDNASTDPSPIPANAGGSRELVGIALPLVVSQSFMTVQVMVDAFLLSWHNPDEMAASLPAMMWYWLMFGLLQVTAGYTSTFVAQYTGAHRPHRVGPAVWQGIYFAIICGILFMAVAPLAPWLISIGGHTPNMQILEAIYLKTLAFAALPMLVMSAINGFFSGRGQTWVVLAIEVVGTLVNVILSLVLIFGRAGFPEMGIAGAGWATVAGSWVSAVFALGLFLMPTFRRQFATLSGWRFEAALFKRLMKYGGPAGIQVFLDVLVFHFFIQLVGQMGEAELGATTLTIRFNMVAFLPMMGLGQAVCILVGQRLGGDRPDLAARSTATGLRWAFGYMWLVAAVYVFFPETLVGFFQSDQDPQKFEAIKAFVPKLLLCVAIYSLADAISVTYAFALRGAGDTRFVTIATFILAWPIMVIPTYFAVTRDWGVYWAWIFATAFILAMAICFFLRFRSGVWKTMRVIEPGPAEDDLEPASAPVDAADTSEVSPEPTAVR